MICFVVFFSLGHLHRAYSYLILLLMVGTTYLSLETFIAWICLRSSSTSSTSSYVFCVFWPKKCNMQSKAILSSPKRSQAVWSTHQAFSYFCWWIKICIQSGEGFYMGYNILSRTISKVGHYSLNKNAHYTLYLHFKWKYKL